MSYKVARLSAIGMMVFFAPLAFAGCLAQESDESATDESASELKLDSIRCDDIQTEVCQSGWPGTRLYNIGIFSPTDIVPGTISAAISGLNGEVSHSVSQSGTRQINFTATIREGDAFSPGKNTTTYNITWCRQ